MIYLSHKDTKTSHLKGEIEMPKDIPEQFLHIWDYAESLVFWVLAAFGHIMSLEKYTRLFSLYFSAFLVFSSKGNFRIP